METKNWASQIEEIIESYIALEKTGHIEKGAVTDNVNWSEIITLISQVEQNARKETVNDLVKLFDELENSVGVPDDSWRAYKFIRNNIRDWAKLKGILTVEE